MDKLISEAYNEHCLNTLARIPNGSINFFPQDTPFGCTQNKWDVKPDLKALWPEWLRAGTPNACFLFFATQPFASELIASMPKLFKYDLIWHKSQPTGFLNAQKQPLREHESILIFYRKQPIYNPQIELKPVKNIRRVPPQDRKSSNYGSFKSGNHRTIPDDMCYPKSIIYYPSEQGIKHPTVKPVGLLRYFIKTFTNPGDWVFDGYLGSGTTRIASHLENRNFIGSENDTEEGYFLYQEERYKSLIQAEEAYRKNRPPELFDHTTPE